MSNQENEHELSVMSGTTANTGSTQGLLISTPGGLSQTDQHVEFFIKKIPRRMRLMKKCAKRAQNRARRAQKQKRKDRQNYLIRLCRLPLKIFAWLLMVLGFVFAIYLAYHFSGPANDIGQKGLDATVWGNYYNWVWTICPAMENQNLTTIECQEAQNNTVAPPSKPSTSVLTANAQSLARRFTSIINVDHDIETIFLAANSHCSISTDIDRTNFSKESNRCDAINLSHFDGEQYKILKTDSWNGWNVSKHFTIELRTLEGSNTIKWIPLPPSKGSDIKPIITWIQWVVFFIVWLHFLWTAYIHPILGLLSAHGSHPNNLLPTLRKVESTTNLTSNWKVVLLRMLHMKKFDIVHLGFLRLALYYSPVIIGLVGAIQASGSYLELWNLARWIAIDQGLDACLNATSKNLIGGHPVCQQLLYLSAHMSTSERVKVWAIWRTYIIAEIAKASLFRVLPQFLANTLLVLVFYVWALQRQLSSWLSKNIGAFGEAEIDECNDSEDKDEEDYNDHAEKINEKEDSKV